MSKKVLYTIARIVLGLAFIFFGGGKFFPAQMPMLPQPALDLLTAFGASGYMIPLIGLAEVLVGILLLFNRAVPLAMIILSPVMLNIILFNIFLAPSAMGLIVVGIPLLLQVYIMYVTWPAYKPLFQKVKVNKS